MYLLQILFLFLCSKQGCWGLEILKLNDTVSIWHRCFGHTDVLYSFFTLSHYIFDRKESTGEFYLCICNRSMFGRLRLKIPVSFKFPWSPSRMDCNISTKINHFLLKLMWVSIRRQTRTDSMNLPLCYHVGFENCPHFSKTPHSSF